MINVETIVVVIITSMGAAILGLIPGYWKMRADREQLELSKATFVSSITQKAQEAAQGLIEQQMEQINSYIERLEKLEKALDHERTRRLELAGELDVERGKRVELERQLELEKARNGVLEEKLSKAEATIEANEKLIQVLTLKVKALEKDTGELRERSN